MTVVAMVTVIVGTMAMMVRVMAVMKFLSSQGSQDAHTT